MRRNVTPGPYPARGFRVFDAPAPVSAPFPWFGGKAEIAAAVWERFGNVPNFVDGCCGSLAVPLHRPHAPKTETLNDADGGLVNFWRAVSVDPDAVAHEADWPVSELDLSARHAYLVRRIPWLVEQLAGDPFFFDPRLAGWWVWGQCAWIGSGFCSGSGPWQERGGVLQKIGAPGDAGRGINRKLPHLGDAGQGINRQLPHLGDAGRGINRQLPHLGDAGREEDASGFSARGLALRAWFRALQDRLRDARFTCGDVGRVLTPAVTIRHGLTGVFLDPPYFAGEAQYAGGGSTDACALAAWCRENGENPLLRIALCGHAGDYDLPDWEILSWRSSGGYGNAGGVDSEDNRHRETIWFSPSCLGGRQRDLFEVRP